MRVSASIRLRPIEHVTEQAELPIGIGGGRLCARAIDHDAGVGCDQRHAYACCRTEEYQGSCAHHHSGGPSGLAEFHKSTGLAWTARFCNGNGRLRATGSPILPPAPALRSKLTIIVSMI